MTAPVTDWFRTILEGHCPQCGGPLTIADLGDPEPHAPPRCGWCAPCGQGWAAFTWRGEDDGPFHPGEPVISRYLAPALAAQFDPPND